MSNLSGFLLGGNSDGAVWLKHLDCDWAVELAADGYKAAYLADALATARRHVAEHEPDPTLCGGDGCGGCKHCRSDGTGATPESGADEIAAEETA